MKNLCLIILLALCIARANADQLTNVIYGNAADYRLNPAKKVTVSLSLTYPNPRLVGNTAVRSDDISTLTDTNGYFAFTNLQWGYYTLTISGRAGTEFPYFVHPDSSGNIAFGSLIPPHSPQPPNPASNYYTKADIDALVAALLSNNGNGSGNVTGPVSSQLHNLAAFAAVNGQVLEDSGIPFASIALNAYVAGVSNLWLNGSNNLNTATVAVQTFSTGVSNKWYTGSNTLAGLPSAATNSLASNSVLRVTPEANFNTIINTNGNLHIQVGDNSVSGSENEFQLNDGFETGDSIAGPYAYAKLTLDAATANYFFNSHGANQQAEVEYSSYHAPILYLNEMDPNGDYSPSNSIITIDGTKGLNGTVSNRYGRSLEIAPESSLHGTAGGNIYLGVGKGDTGHPDGHVVITNALLGGSTDQGVAVAALGIAADGSVTTNSVPGGGGGEANTAANLGTDPGAVASKAGITLQFRGFLGTGGAAVTTNTTNVIISADAAGAAATAQANAATYTASVSNNVLTKAGTNIPTLFNPTNRYDSTLTNSFNDYKGKVFADFYVGTTNVGRLEAGHAGDALIASGRDDTFGFIFWGLDDTSGISTINPKQPLVAITGYGDLIVKQRLYLGGNQVIFDTDNDAPNTTIETSQAGGELSFERPPTMSGAHITSGSIPMAALNTNVVTATNQPWTVGQGVVVKGTNSSGQPVLGATNWPTGGGGGSGDVVAANVNTFATSNIFNGAIYANGGLVITGAVTLGTLDATNFVLHGDLDFLSVYGVDNLKFSTWTNVGVWARADAAIDAAYGSVLNITAGSNNVSAPGALHSTNMISEHFIGNGASITNNNAATMTGTVTNPIVSPSITGNGSGITNILNGNTVSAGANTTVTLSQNPNGSTNFQVAATGGGGGGGNSIVMWGTPNMGMAASDQKYAVPGNSGGALGAMNIAPTCASAKTLTNIVVMFSNGDPLVAGTNAVFRLFTNGIYAATFCTLQGGMKITNSGTFSIALPPMTSWAFGVSNTSTSQAIGGGFGLNVTMELQ